MTAEIVNLNKVRKAKERAEKERQAEENRIRFGLPKEERARMATEMARFEAALDAAMREAPGEKAKSTRGGGAADDDIDPGSAS